ncbi:putative leucine-rich repeat receptor-like protein kinase At2g19210 isoform X1 [Typha latifolia]|uniref:putative leucine-rich repeat receptor-like protein kinase At2g19210 isoform X1 n=1 Tax=Typha latifolia TaxID=4733 RepID=UPI003C2C2143
MGIPFISGLELRPINKNEVYPFVNVTQAVDLHRRLNVGPTDNGLLIRYPDDPYDRIWEPWSNVPYWAEISTSSAIQGADNDLFEVPSVVMQTAIQPVDSTDIKFYWAPKPQDKDPKYIAVMHFAELQKLKRKDLRQFEVYLNGIPWYDQAINPRYLYRDTVYNSNPKRGYLQYNILVSATSNSTLPPIINAMEIFMVLQTAELATDSEDVIAINAIKRSYQVKKNWIGDPCAPKIYAWERVNCSYAFSNPPRITTLNLSSNGLVGSISTAFANLTAIQYLDLSHNNLTGSIPDVLGQLPSLVFLDLTNNQLNGSIPANLLKKSQDGSLTLRVGDNLNLCANGTSCELPPNKKSSAISAVIIVPVIVLVLLLVVIFVLCRMRKWRALAANTSVRPQSEYNLKRKKDYADNSLQLENRQFTYKELEVITEKFQRVLGEGGFGAVYDGFLEDGTQVAVKILSQSSSQGFKEFLAEAQHLARVHHRNLVSMIGYCNDGENLALVYEFMSEGTLQDHLRGRSDRARPLTWRQRLHIALESAQGLEYLHKGCKPPLIHRDVKTNNILLNANLEAKIADFGLSKAFNSDINTHVSTAVVGTPGYLDPEYYSTFQISEKSDVYSFGVVLLEVITGQPSILPGAERVHVIHWVRQRLAKGFIETIVDERMEGKFNVNSVWKVADIALKCTAQSSNDRPTMTDVVMQLKECLELEGAGQGSNNLYSGSSNPHPRSDNLYSEPSEISQNSAFEMEHMAMLSPANGPAAR